MKQVYNTCFYWKCVIRNVNICFFLNLLESNTTNIVKDIFIIPTEDTQKITPGKKSADTTKTTLIFLKKFRILMPDKY